MRIITGEYKGRRLSVPKDKEIRPTTDRVKEAIFSMLESRIQDSVVLDLFAGTGNLGLEALSRGARHCYFCDVSPVSLDLIRGNIQYCRAEERSTVLAGDYRSALRRMQAPCDLVFVDPPFQKGMMRESFDYIREYQVLAPEGIIVAEHGKRETLPDQIGDFVRIKEKKYGNILISMYSCHDQSEYGTI